MENLMLDIMYELPNIAGEVAKVKITGECVLDDISYLHIKDEEVA